MGGAYEETKEGIKLLMMDTPNNVCFNSQLLSHLLQHRLSTSLATPRTYAFQPYVLPAGSSPFSVFSLHSPTIPLTAFLRHFLTPKTNTISSETYERICPVGQRIILGLETPSHMRPAWEQERFEGKWTKGMKELISLPNPSVGIADRLRILAKAMELWKDEKCVEVKGDLLEYLSSSTEGEGHLWDVLKESEGVKGWKWGDAITKGVTSAVEKLVQGGGVVVGAGTPTTAGVAGVVLGKKGSAFPEEVAAAPSGALPAPEVLVGLMALHLPLLPRSQCSKAAASTSNFTSFSSSPLLADRFPSISSGLYPQEKDTIYLDHCAPNFERVISRSGRLRREHPRLRSLFVSGMEDLSWRERSAWKKAFESPESEGGGGWKSVYFEGDLGLPWGMKQLGVGVSMELMRRAELFIGNGFSPLTGNVVMLRQRDARPHDTTRFW